jgi:hypothetical protein
VGVGLPDDQVGDPDYRQDEADGGVPPAGPDTVAEHDHGERSGEHDFGHGDDRAGHSGGAPAKRRRVEGHPEGGEAERDVGEWLCGKRIDARCGPGLEQQGADPDGRAPVGASSDEGPGDGATAEGCEPGDEQDDERGQQYGEERGLWRGPADRAGRARGEQAEPDPGGGDGAQVPARRADRSTACASRTAIAVCPATMDWTANTGKNRSAKMARPQPSTSMTSPMP